jgi:hypothetical protein
MTAFSAVGRRSGALLLLTDDQDNVVLRREWADPGLSALALTFIR